MHLQLRCSTRPGDRQGPIRPRDRGRPLGCVDGTAPSRPRGSRDRQVAYTLQGIWGLCDPSPPPWADLAGVLGVIPGVSPRHNPQNPRKVAVSGPRQPP